MKQSQQFVCIQIDCDRDKETPKRYHVQGYPTVLFLKPDGKAIEELASRAPAAVAKQMERVAREHR